MYQDGRLSYSFDPGKPVRDELSVSQAAMTFVASSKDVHIDTATATFHMKCLNAEDYETWKKALR